MRLTVRARTAIVLCALFISGCAALRPPSVTVDPAQVSAFELNGRVNVRVEKAAYPGRIRWQHEADRDEVWLYSPVGTAVAHLQQDARGALLVTSDGKEHRAADIRLLAREVLGYELPLDQLQYWVRGLPAPELGAPKRDDDDLGRPKSIEQGDWQVAYLDWEPAGASGLPSKLDVVGERMRMRLVVDQWKIDATTP